jgi:drug/metabolite transporter (DMT)-like permease
MKKDSQISSEDRVSGIILGVLAGVMLGIHMSSWLESLAFASVAVSTTIVCTHALFSSLFSSLIGEPPKKSQIGGILISLVGVFFLSGADPRSTIEGVLLALIGAISGGAYFTLGRISRHKTNLTNYLLVTYFTAALISLFFALITGEQLVGFRLSSWIYLLLLALIPNVIGHSLLNLSLRYSTATTVTGTVLGEPVGATILAYFILNQHPPVMVYVYMIVVLFGVGVTLKSGLEL